MAGQAFRNLSNSVPGPFFFYTGPNAGSVIVTVSDRILCIRSETPA